MLSLKNIKDWLEKLDNKSIADITKMSVKDINNLSIKQLYSNGYIVANHFYIGKLDNKKMKSIGVYQLPTSSRNVAIGGLENT